MQVSVKSMRSLYENVADEIARLDIDQEERERVADALTRAFVEARAPRFRPDVFRLLASDPLCTCAGPEQPPFAKPCPDGREIRIGMHLSTAPDGRSARWEQRKPITRCLSCGSALFLRGRNQGEDAPKGVDLDVVDES
jgi:hypothetical protein